jgi:hypothetical protein
MEPIKPAFYVCFCCGGDGKDTCTNPDHGFISAMPGDIGRLGCPVCGHDPYHKVPSGGDCECCKGKGFMELDEWEKWADEYYFDEDPIEYEEFVYVPSEEIIMLEERLDLMIDNFRIHNRINGVNLLLNDFTTCQYLNVSPLIKRVAKETMTEYIIDAVLKERIHEFSNSYQIQLIEHKYLNQKS